MSTYSAHDAAYGRLEASEIIRTVEKLSDRIRERFPKAGLRDVSGRLGEIARQASERSEKIGRPIYWLRFLTFAVTALILIVFGLAIANVRPPDGAMGLAEFVQLLESGINDLVLIGAALLFLVTFEARIKRRRALTAIHELRALAHIIDMHQLTKDPEHIVFGRRRTAASPKHDMTPFQLERYLDYCSEMLALIGKVAALYVQRFEDTQAVAAVNDIEQLTTGLSRKIWQKIMILHSVCGPNLPDKPVVPNTAPTADGRAATVFAAPKPIT